VTGTHGSSDIVIVAGLILTFLGTVFSGVMTYLKQKDSDRKAETEAANRAREAEEAKRRQQEAAEITRMHRELMAAKMDANTTAIVEAKQSSKEASEKITAVTETVLRGTGDGTLKS